MSEARGADRRELLAALLAAVGAGLWPAACAPRPDAATAAAELTGFMLHPTDWAALGRAAIDHGLAPAGERELAAVVAAELEWRPGRWPVGEVGDRIRQAVATAHREDRVVRLAGWRLSRIEIALAALAALSPP